MRGRIIFINPQTMTGLIFGADRNRYNFELKEWAEPGVPARNLEVNFQVVGGDALRIKPFSADYVDEKPMPALKKPRAGKPEKTPELAAPAGAAHSFSDQGDDTAEETLATGPAPLTAKMGRPAAVRLDNRVLLDGDMAAAKPAWKYYLIGVAAFFVLLLVAFLIRKILG